MAPQDTTIPYGPNGLGVKIIFTHKLIDWLIGLIPGAGHSHHLPYGVCRSIGSILRGQFP